MTLRQIRCFMENSSLRLRREAVASVVGSCGTAQPSKKSESTTWTAESILIRRRAVTVVILTALVFADGVTLGQADANFSFPSDSPYLDDSSNFVIPDGSDAMYLGGSYRMNTGSVASDNNLSCGRVAYKDKIRMLDKVSLEVASFYTSFTFSFESNWNASSPQCGDGMVFAFYRDYSLGDREKSRHGGGFCVLNFSEPHERQFAVEIDSYYNYGNFNYNDFSDSHIGVNFGNENISSRYDLCDNTTGQCASEYDVCYDKIIKTNTESANSTYMSGYLAGYCQYFCRDKTANYTVWIDYDSVGQTLEVRFKNGSSANMIGKPAKAINTLLNLRLNELLDEEIEMHYVGFTASTGDVREVHTIKSWEFVSIGMPDAVQVPSPAPTYSEGSASKRKSVSMIASTCSAVVAAVAVGVPLYYTFIVYKKRRRPLRNQELVSCSRDSDTSMRAFTFGELSRSTKNFSACELLASGTFGNVYRGLIPSGALVAVKRIKENQEKGEESFLAEATSLKQIRHRNLLQQRGWSHTREGLFLVYDYICNESLDKWIHRSFTRSNEFQVNVIKAVLSWNARRFILAGVASGLEYLHEVWCNVFYTETSNPVTCCWMRISMPTWVTLGLPV